MQVKYNTFNKTYIRRGEGKFKTRNYPVKKFKVKTWGTSKRFKYSKEPGLKKDK